MQIETVGRYQLHLIAHEISGNRWDPFVSVYEFDDEIRDFKCVHEKMHAAQEPAESYEAAIEIARRTGNDLIHQSRH